MTIEIEVPDEKAMALLKQLEELNIIKLFFPQTNQVVEEEKRDADVQKQEEWGPKQQAEMMALSGSLNMDPERFKEYEKFLHNIRNEWE